MSVKRKSGTASVNTESQWSKEACFAHATQVWLAVNHNTSVTSGECIRCSKRIARYSELGSCQSNVVLFMGLGTVAKKIKLIKGAKIRNRYNQVPHLTQDTNGKKTNSQLDTTNESQEVNPFPAGDHQAHINRRAQRHSKRKTEQKHKRCTKEVPPWNGQ